MTDKDAKGLKDALISHMADDKLNFSSLISLTAKTQESVALICNDMGYIKEDIKEIKEIMSSRYVSKEEFDPVKKIAYTIMWLLVGGVVGAVSWGFKILLSIK